MNNNISFINDLSWRGMIHDSSVDIDALFTNNIVSAYIGFDATADSLHVGHLMQIMTLVHFQRAGHKPFILVGGATSMVGDPTGKSQERSLLDIDTLRHYQDCIAKQLSKFMDFSPSDNQAEIVNNYDWLKDYSFLNFIRDVGKHITVNYMMAKDSVKNRFSGDTGISFTEFCYQLVQGYDFYYLFDKRNCLLQMGGSDQWGNITTGIELIRRKTGQKAYGITTKLIKKADGTKFGKTEGGAVWLDRNKTSPYSFYQFWLNAADQDAAGWIKYFTLKSKEEIEDIITRHMSDPGKRLLQKELANELTTTVHSKEDADKSAAAAEFLFGNTTTVFINGLSDREVEEIFYSDNIFTLSKNDISEPLNIINLIVDKTEIIKSRSEARRLIAQRGILLNKSKVLEDNYNISDKDLLNGKYLIIQKGKKNYFLIKFI